MKSHWQKTHSTPRVKWVVDETVTDTLPPMYFCVDGKLSHWAYYDVISNMWEVYSFDGSCKIVYSRDGAIAYVLGGIWS